LSEPSYLTTLLVVAVATVVLGCCAEVMVGINKVPSWLSIPVVGSRVAASAIVVAIMLTVPTWTRVFGGAVVACVVTFGVLKLASVIKARYRQKPKRSPDVVSGE
jgi:hypothetical protein